MKGIYKITSPSGSIYIGQSKNIKSRFEQYRNRGAKTQTALQNSFYKYGVPSHSFEVIHELPPDIEHAVLDQYETLYIDLYRNVGGRMLNIRDGGAHCAPGNKGMKVDETTKVQMKQSQAARRAREREAGHIVSWKGRPNIRKGISLTQDQKNSRAQSLAAGYRKKHGLPENAPTPYQLNYVAPVFPIRSDGLHGQCKDVINLKTGETLGSAQIAHTQQNRYGYIYFCEMLRGKKPNKTDFMYLQDFQNTELIKCSAIYTND